MGPPFYCDVIILLVFFVPLLDIVYSDYYYGTYNSLVAIIYIIIIVYVKEILLTIVC